MKQKTLHIGQDDYLLANRRARRLAEIEEHGKLVSGRRMLHRSKKAYDRKRLKPVSDED